MSDMEPTVNERIERLLGQLTLEEKVGMVHGATIFRTKGVERLGIPPLRMSDGPMGVRMEMKDDAFENCSTADDVTYLPSNSAIAASWNRDVARASGRVLGEEARGRGKDMILAPGINIQRSPLCGRNFEYMSEDPCLIAELAVPLIEGIQENDVSACVKHFAANNQEAGRIGLDVRVDERTLHELYLPGFKAAVQKAHSHALMGAYNRLNGDYCCHSKFLLEDLLRREWGYDGAVVSDWGAVHDTKAAAGAELDIEMDVRPHFDGYYLANPLLEAVRRGEVKEERIDKKVRNILRLMFRLKMIGPEKETRRAGCYNSAAHREAVLRAAQESVVLLKNAGGRLPIRRRGLKKLAVIGLNAAQRHAAGGGSAEIKALYEISPLMGLCQLLGGNTEVRYAQGYCPDPQPKDGETADPQALAQKRQALLDEAAALAKSCDEVLLFGGLDHAYDVEGKDRPDMRLPYGQDALFNAVLDANPRAAVVLVAGSPVDMSAWAGRAQAIVWSWYAGMEGGYALAQVLLGEVNPSGKLPVTLPVRYEDSPAAALGEFGDAVRTEYKEGLLVGYRYFDTQGVEPAFCFGYGLSYTTFAYRSAQVRTQGSAKAFSVQAEVALQNTGDAAGAEVVQVYVSQAKPSVFRPVQELKGFEKVFLHPGEEKIVSIHLETDAFAWYDTAQHAFTVEPGVFTLRIGSSSRDIRLEKQVRVERPYRL